MIPVNPDTIRPILIALAGLLLVAFVRGEIVF
jgi:hypothetical protein